MATCSSCGTENAEGSKFCNECATPLTAPLARTEERKFVTALFCDLVAFTATSEAADPEDVDKMLAAYFEMARSAIEAFGGTVEKFIGDAVVGVFGVPSAHEDDPERAVRAGLQIAEDAEELISVGGAPLKLRVGINTGEALVRLGVSAASGEGFISGDSINTASRLQSVAPAMGVAVGLSTFEATTVVFDYEELKPATLKGKSEPVRVFHAKSPRARFGTDLTRTHDSPFIGREFDLERLKGLFEKTLETDSPQLVTVVGEPGIGKSRIVAELFAYTDARPELITWRQGRCLPYGDGVTFWALGEIVKAHAGILESDDPERAATKIGDAVPDRPDGEWLRQRLLPLVGVDASSPAEREESFAAWRVFLESVAEQTPTVLVFEDIHWADDAMLAFLEHLAGRAERVPLLLVATARPELFERHPDFAAALAHANKVSLAPLTDTETAALISGLLGAAEIPEEIQGPILERAEGNPLFVEQFLRLLKDQDLLHHEGDAWLLREGEELLPLPGSIQSLIAARLDMLAPEQKAMLSDASVVGKVFWAGAVAAMGDRRIAEVTEAMRKLSRIELVRPARRSSMEGEAEFAFWHALTRDIAYSQLPRQTRADKHVAVAQWLEIKAGERVEDIAEVLAHHYATALELARAAGLEGREPLDALALRFLTLAGERALTLDQTAALALFERGLALAPPGHPARPKLLMGFALSVRSSGRLIEARDTLEEAIVLFRQRGDLAALADALVYLEGVLWRLGDSTRAEQLQSEYLALYEELPSGQGRVDALLIRGDLERAERPEVSLEYADRALSLADELSLDRAEALGTRALYRCQLGDARGLKDLRVAIELSIRSGRLREAAIGHLHLGACLVFFEGPAVALDILRAGLALAQSGHFTVATWLEVDVLGAVSELGGFDEALEGISRCLQRWEQSEDLAGLVTAFMLQARLLALRGRSQDVADSLDWLESGVRKLEEPQVVVEGLATSALARLELGQRDAAVALLTAIEANRSARGSWNYTSLLPTMVRTALAARDPALATRLVSDLELRWPYTDHALVAANAALAESHGDLRAAADAYTDAADRWERFGIVPEQAFALLGNGRCLLGLARPTVAAPVLQRAREIFARLKAAPALAETDEHLQRATALSS